MKAPSDWTYTELSNAADSLSDAQAVAIVRAFSPGTYQKNSLRSLALGQGWKDVHEWCRQMHPELFQGAYGDGYLLQCACAGGHPDLVQDMLDHLDAPLDEHDASQALIALMTGRGHRGIHPRAPEALVHLLRRPETQALRPMMDLWQQWGVYPRAMFLPTMLALKDDPDHPYHPLFPIETLTATLIAAAGCLNQDQAFPSDHAQIAHALWAMVPRQAAMEVLRSDVFMLVRMERSHLIEPVVDSLTEKASPDILPWPILKSMLRRTLGPTVFPKELAARREAELAHIDPAVSAPTSKRRLRG